MSERKGSGVFTAGRTGEGGVAADPVAFGVDLFLLMVGLSQMGAL